MKLKDIKPNPNNPRVIKGEKFDKLKKSISEFPKMMALRPIVIDGKNQVLGGNMRLKALESLGFKEIPDNWVRRAEELTEEEKERFIIADNVGFGEWDWETLSNEWDVSLLGDWGLDIPDFGLDQDIASDDDFNPESTIVTDIVLGDLIEIGRHRLLCGDATDINQIHVLLNGCAVDMVFTDPPFDMDVKTFSHLLQEFAGIMQVWITSDKQAAKLIDIFEDYFYTTFILVTGNSLIKNNRQPIVTHCMMPVFWFHESKNDLKNFTTIIEAGRDLYMAGKGASHAKSVKTYESIINNFTDESAVIADFFAHSGSLMFCAHQLGRSAYCMELDPKYCQMIIDRMKKLDKNIPVKINGKDYEWQGK